MKLPSFRKNRPQPNSQAISRSPKLHPQLHTPLAAYHESVRRLDQYCEEVRRFAGEMAFRSSLKPEERVAQFKIQSGIRHARPPIWDEQEEDDAKQKGAVLLQACIQSADSDDPVLLWHRAIDQILTLSPHFSLRPFFLVRSLSGPETPFLCFEAELWKALRASPNEDYHDFEAEPTSYIVTWVTAERINDQQVFWKFWGCGVGPQGTVSLFAEFEDVAQTKLRTFRHLDQIGTVQAAFGELMRAHKRQAVCIEGFFPQMLEERLGEAQQPPFTVAEAHSDIADLKGRLAALLNTHARFGSDADIHTDATYSTSIAFPHDEVFLTTERVTDGLLKEEVRFDLKDIAHCHVSHHEMSGRLWSWRPQVRLLFGNSIPYHFHISSPDHESREEISHTTSFSIPCDTYRGAWLITQCWKEIVGQSTGKSLSVGFYPEPVALD